VDNAGGWSPHVRRGARQSGPKPPGAPSPY